MSSFIRTNRENTLPIYALPSVVLLKLRHLHSRNGPSWNLHHINGLTVAFILDRYVTSRYTKGLRTVIRKPHSETQNNKPYCPRQYYVVILEQARKNGSLKIKKAAN